MTIRMFWRWLRLWPLDFLSTLASYILAPFVVPLALGDHLPDGFHWMETHDNGLDGDAGWKKEHWQWRYFLPEWMATYVGRVGWLWRNPAYRFAHDVLGAQIPDGMPVVILGDIKTADRPGHGGWLLIMVGGYWEFYLVLPYGSTGRCLRARFGWKLKGYAESWLRGERAAVTGMFAVYVNPVKTFEIKEGEG